VWEVSEEDVLVGVMRPREYLSDQQVFTADEAGVGRGRERHFGYMEEFSFVPFHVKCVAFYDACFVSRLALTRLCCVLLSMWLFLSFYVVTDARAEKPPRT